MTNVFSRDDGVLKRNVVIAINRLLRIKHVFIAKRELAVLANGRSVFFLITGQKH